MIFDQPTGTMAPLRDAIDGHTRADACLTALLGRLELDPTALGRIDATARALVTEVRGARHRPGGIDAFLQEYGLSTQEGVMLMCIAEALLRVPDAETMDALIEDKIAPSDWGRHLGHSASSLVNASTWALMLTGRVWPACWYLARALPPAGGAAGRACGARPWARRSGARSSWAGPRRCAGARRGCARLRHSYDMLGRRRAPRPMPSAFRGLPVGRRHRRGGGGRGPVDPGISIAGPPPAMSGTRVMDGSCRAAPPRRRRRRISACIDAEEADRLTSPST